MKVNPSFCLSIWRGAAELRALLPFRDSGDHAFFRYENGKTEPPSALVKLLKVLDRHPDLLDEIKVVK